MNIMWTDADESDCEIIESWINSKDRRNLCMEDATWKSVADTLRDFTGLSDGGYFKNVIARVSGKPVAALMLGTTCSGGKLRLYNIVINPEYRGRGLGVILTKTAMKADTIFGIPKTYNKIEVSVLPGNERSIKIVKSCGFEVAQHSIPKNFKYVQELNHEITFEKSCTQANVKE